LDSLIGFLGDEPLARRRWDRRLVAAGRPAGVRITDDHTQHARAVDGTASALANGAGAIHEAAFTFEGVKVRVDVLERLGDGTFALHEVKSTSKYEEKKHLLDTAVQLWVVRGTGVPVSYVGLVHINSEYEWPGGDYDLEQLFREEELTEAAEARQEAVGIDVARLLRVLESDDMPAVPDDVKHKAPYECPYLEICPVVDHSIEHPVGELPSCSEPMRKRADAAGCRSLLEIDDQTAQQILIYSDGRPHDRWFYTWRATVTGQRIILDECPPWIDGLAYPIRHLDFETVGAPLPIVLHARPFEAVPLQYSIHVEDGVGEPDHREFIAESDDSDPRRSLIERISRTWASLATSFTGVLTRGLSSGTWPTTLGTPSTASGLRHWSLG
jgi:CRISPR/Cas system-associated exonuclease Cas4 (RecB family)